MTRLAVFRGELNVIADINKEEFLTLAAAEYDALRAVGQARDFYTPEAQFDQFWTALGRLVLERTIGAVRANWQKNVARTRYGRIVIAKGHPFSQPVLGSRMSLYLQAKLVYLGSEQVFARMLEVVGGVFTRYRSRLNALKIRDTILASGATSLAAEMPNFGTAKRAKYLLRTCRA